MRYDVILFTRSIKEDEDYHWCSCPEYVNRKELYDYLQPLINHVRRCSEDFNEIWKKQYMFLNLENYSLCVRMYESEYTDFGGRNIFVIEGIVCNRMDRNFMFHDLVNAVQYLDKSSESIQEIYYQQGMCQGIDIPNLINPKKIVDEKMTDTFLSLVRFIRCQNSVCNVFWGSMDSIPSFLFKQYQFADINSYSEIEYQHVVQEYSESKNYVVKMEMAMGKKWIAEYALKACDVGNDSVYVRMENDFFEEKIEYANLYAQNKLLNHIMNVLWG